MALQTNAIKNALADRYGATALFAALSSTVPGAFAGTELSGGTPAYARKELTWGTAANGATTATGPSTFRPARPSPGPGPGPGPGLGLGSALPKGLGRRSHLSSPSQSRT